MSESDSLPPKAFRVVDVARALGLARSTVYGWIKDGRFPAIQIGKTVMVLEADLKEFLVRHRLGASK